MHNLVIDIGNSKSKISIFKEKELLFYKAVDALEEQLILDLIGKFQVKNAIVSDVASGHANIIELLKVKTSYIPFSTSKNTGINNFYQSKATLGLDRWANVIAVHQLYPGHNCFVIDAGTCITYDLLNSAASYYGGSISMGIQMRFAALNHFTGRLPLVDWDRDADIPAGDNTSNAIRSGVLQGVIKEVEGFIALQNETNKDLKVVITGGDGAFLLKQLKNSIFAPQITHDPYLVLKGLNEVIAFEYV
jgi:type III pantothenate kinase